MIDVSFVIVSWNAREHLVKCLDSIAETVHDLEYEVIVVDNASSDGSPEAVAADYAEVNLIQTGANLGFARGNNVGIRESQGRYLCLINSDVVLLPECVTRLRAFMDENDAIGMVGPRVLNPDGSLQPSCRRLPTLFRTFCSAVGVSSLFPRSSALGGTFMTWWNHDEQRPVDVVSGCFMMLRREAADEIGLFDEDFFMYGEDIDWCRRFRANDWPVIFYPDAEAIHYGGASSSNQPAAFFLVMQQARLRYWKKHHSLFSAFVLLDLMLLHHGLRIVGQSALLLLGRGNRRLRAHKVRRSWATIAWILTGAGLTDGQQHGFDLHSEMEAKS